MVAKILTAETKGKKYFVGGGGYPEGSIGLIFFLDFAFFFSGQGRRGIRVRGWMRDLKEIDEYDTSKHKKGSINACSFRHGTQSGGLVAGGVWSAGLWKWR